MCLRLLPISCVMPVSTKRLIIFGLTNPTGLYPSEPSRAYGCRGRSSHWFATGYVLGRGYKPAVLSVWYLITIFRLTNDLHPPHRQTEDESSGGSVFDRCNPLYWLTSTGTVRIRILRNSIAHRSLLTAAMSDMQPNCLGIQVYEIQTQDLSRLKFMGSLIVMYFLYERIHI